MLKKSLVSPPVCLLVSQMGRHPYLYDSHASESGWDDGDEKTHQALQRGSLKHGRLVMEVGLD